MKFKHGDTVNYRDCNDSLHEVFIEEPYNDGTYKIANPFWSWDDEGLYTHIGEVYGVPYWITVNESDLEPIK